VVLLLGVVLRPFNFDRAFGHEGRNCPYSCQRRRKCRADHADGEWKLRYRSTIFDESTGVRGGERCDEERSSRRYLIVAPVERFALTRMSGGNHANGNAFHH
jgi:hypothetical protein